MSHRYVVNHRTKRPLNKGYNTTDKLSAVSYDPLSHSRHNAEYRSRKVGREISVVVVWRSHQRDR